MKFDFLNNLSLGDMQVSGAMSVIPLIGEDATNSIASFEEITFEKTSDYGVMVFSNKSNKPFILPSGFAIMTKQKAQDHALVYSTFLKPDSTRSIKNACCIQQTQCGYIDGKGIKGFNFIPVEIRKNGISKYTECMDTSFSRLWPLISDFQKKLVKEHDSNLIFYFNKYMDKLVTYNAEFECVPKQRGAIILYCNKVVGIEVVPTHDYWKTIWNPLIRDAYGSTILKKMLSEPVNSFISQKDDKKVFEKVSSLEELSASLKNLPLQKKLSVFEEINNIAETDFEEYKTNMARIDGSTDFEKDYSLNHKILKKEKSVCEAILENKKLIYFSYLA